MGLCSGGKRDNYRTTWLVDYIFIASRSAAKVFIPWYNQLVNPGLYGDEWVYRLNVSRNSEILAMHIAKQHHIWVKSVPPSLIPFQRVARFNNTLCWHHKCTEDLDEKFPS